MNSPDTILRSTSLRISRTSACTGLRSATTREATAKNDCVPGPGQIETWAAKFKAVYVYFENDQAGYAAANALTLKSMVLGTPEEKVA